MAETVATHLMQQGRNEDPDAIGNEKGSVYTIININCIASKANVIFKAYWSSYRLGMPGYSAATLKFPGKSIHTSTSFFKGGKRMLKDNPKIKNT